MIKLLFVVTWTLIPTHEKSSDASYYLNILTSYNCISGINYYTRIFDISVSCIDNIFIRNINISNAN